MISSGIHFKSGERILLLHLLVFKSEIGMGNDGSSMYVIYIDVMGELKKYPD